MALASTFAEAEAPPRRLLEGPLKLICDFVMETNVVSITLMMTNFIVIIFISSSQRNKHVIVTKEEKKLTETDP